MANEAFFIRLIVVVLFACTIGCRSHPPGESVPRAAGLSDAQIMEALARRADRVQRVMSAGTMRLETGEGESVRLDVALLASGDDRFRLRAWKLGRAVFDLTRDGDTLWLWHANQDADAQAGTGGPALPNAAQLSAGWRLVCGHIFAEAPDTLKTGDPLTATYGLAPQAPGAVAQLAIDRDSQTVTRITILGPAGETRAVYEPARYRLIDGVPWPTQLALRSEGVAFEITLDDVELNGELPAGAFDPPRDARKLP